MHVVIVGAARFGVATAAKLIEDGHNVVLVESSRERLDEIADELDCGMIEGDGTLPNILREAKGDAEGDVLCCLTDHSDVNILAAVVGRSIGFKRVIPQIVNRELLTICDELGLKDVITPYETVARSIADSIEAEVDVKPDLRLQNELKIDSFTVQARQDGKTIGDLDLPEGVRPVALIRGEEEKLADAETKLAREDILMLVLERDAADKLSELFAEPEDDQPEEETKKE